MACVALSGSADMTESLASGLASVDLSARYRSNVAYGRFFGHGGDIFCRSHIALTIYVAIVAIRRLLTGHHASHPPCDDNLAFSPLDSCSHLRQRGLHIRLFVRSALARSRTG